MDWSHDIAMDKKMALGEIKLVALCTKCNVTSSHTSQDFFSVIFRYFPLLPTWMSILFWENINFVYATFCCWMNTEVNLFRNWFHTADLIFHCNFDPIGWTRKWPPQWSPLVQLHQLRKATKQAAVGGKGRRWPLPWQLHRRGLPGHMRLDAEFSLCISRSTLCCCSLVWTQGGAKCEEESDRESRLIEMIFELFSLSVFFFTSSHSKTRRVAIVRAGAFCEGDVVHRHLAASSPPALALQHHLPAARSQFQCVASVPGIHLKYCETKNFEISVEIKRNN